MANFKYVEDGMGSIDGIGVVYPGLVVSDEGLDLDLSKDDRFESADSDPTDRADVNAVLNRAIVEGDVLVGVEDGTVEAVEPDLTKPEPAPDVQPAPSTPPVVPAPVTVVNNPAPATEA